MTLATLHLQSHTNTIGCPIIMWGTMITTWPRPSRSTRAETTSRWLRAIMYTIMGTTMRGITTQGTIMQGTIMRDTTSSGVEALGLRVEALGLRQRHLHHLLHQDCQHISCQRKAEDVRSQLASITLV